MKAIVVFALAAALVTPTLAKKHLAEYQVGQMGTHQRQDSGVWLDTTQCIEAQNLACTGDAGEIYNYSFAVKTKDGVWVVFATSDTAVLLLAHREGDDIAFRTTGGANGKAAKFFTPLPDNPNKEAKYQALFFSDAYFGRLAAAVQQLNAGYEKAGSSTRATADGSTLTLHSEKCSSQMFEKLKQSKALLQSFATAGFTELIYTNDRGLAFTLPLKGAN